MTEDMEQCAAYLERVQPWTDGPVYTVAVEEDGSCGTGLAKRLYDAEEVAP